MKGKLASSILLLLLLASIPLFFICWKPLLFKSPLFVEFLPAPKGAMVEVFQGQLARLAHLLLALGLLTVFGYNRRDIFLAKGDFSVGAEKFMPFAIKSNESWAAIGRSIGAIIIAVTLAFTFLSLSPSLARLIDSLPQLPIILLNASMNAFYEEVIFRAALIPPLLVLAGKSKTIWITAFIFGAGHLDGNQLSGFLFAFLAFYLGLLLAKSMIETKGILFAWGLHCALDVIIFLDMVIDAQP